MDERVQKLTALYEGTGVVARPFMTGGKSGTLLFQPDLADAVMLRTTLMALEQYKGKIRSVDDAIAAVLTAAECKAVTDEAAEKAIVEGDSVFLIEGFEPIQIATRAYATRAVAEPPAETVTRGPREGFIEDIKTNLSLLERRLKTPALKIERFKLGRQSNTAVAIVYLSSVVDPKVVDRVRQKLNEICVDAVNDSYYVQEAISDHPYSIFAQSGTTEKPDVAAAKMLEGRVAIVVDGSPTVITVPFVLAEDFQSAEDYYERYAFASFLRMLRYAAVMLAVLLPGLYVAMQIYHYEMIPLKFLVTLMNAVAGLPMTPLAETLFVIFLFEIIREAGVRMPRAVGMALSIVGALVLGDTAVKAGLISSPSVMVVALSSLALYTAPKQVGTMSLLRILITLAGGLGGLYGLLLSVLFLFFYLNTLDSYYTPYMAPFAPLVKGDLKDSLVRKPLKKMKRRPASIPNSNATRRG